MKGGRGKLFKLLLGRLRQKEIQLILMKQVLIAVARHEKKALTEELEKAMQI